MAENNLLDPTVCRREDFLPNILESLGVSKQITRNRAVMEDLWHDFDIFLGRSGIDIQKRGWDPSETDIETVRSAIQEKCLVGELGKRENMSLEGEYDICIDTRRQGATRLSVKSSLTEEEIVENSKGRRVRTKYGATEKEYEVGSEGLTMCEMEEDKVSVENDKGEVIDSINTPHQNNVSWNEEGLIMSENYMNTKAVLRWNGKLDRIWENEYRDRDDLRPFAYRRSYDRTLEKRNKRDKFGQSARYRLESHKSYHIADLERSSSDLAPEPGTEELADETDLKDWYEGQDKESLWKKISEKAIAIVNLARRSCVHAREAGSLLLADIEKYCNPEKKVGFGELEGIYAAQQGNSQHIIDAIKNTAAEPEETKEAEGEEL